MNSFVFPFQCHCSLFDWQYLNFGSGNGWAPNRRQAITWASDGPVHCRIYAALGGDELILVYMFEIILQ